MESGIFFANADNVRAAILDVVADDTRIVVLDAETSPFVDVSAVDMLIELAERLDRRGVALRIARDVAQFRAALEAADRSGRVPVYRSVHDAVADSGP